MDEEKKRLEEIRTLVEEHNISVGKLAIASGLSRHLVRGLINDAKSLSSDKYELLKSSIEKIIDNEIPEETLYEVLEYTEPKKPNTDELLNFIRILNISPRKASSALGFKNN